MLTNKPAPQEQAPGTTELPYVDQTDDDNTDDEMDNESTGEDTANTGHRAAAVAPPLVAIEYCILNPDVYNNAAFWANIYDKADNQKAIIDKAADSLDEISISKSDAKVSPPLEALLERIDELGGDLNKIANCINASNCKITLAQSGQHQDLQDRFMSLLTNLTNKRDQRLTAFPDAKEAVSKIIRQLKVAVIIYVNIPTPTLQDLADFQQQCKAAISPALEEGSVLAKHRSLLGETLGALFAGLKNFFAACLHACVPSATKMDFWNTRTDTLKIVQQLQADLEALITDVSPEGVNPSSILTQR